MTIDRLSGSPAEPMEQYLKAVAGQDRAAFERLFRHFAPRLKSYLVKTGVDASTAEEVMQETMVAVWRKASQFDEEKASAATWIFTIARNLRIDIWRRERRPEIDQDDPTLVPDPLPGADAILAGLQDAGRVNAALASLSEAEQAVLRLAYFEEEPQGAISQRLGIPLGTVKSRLRLAFGKLRAALSDGTGAAS